MTNDKNARRVSESKVEQAYILMPKHINESGHLFGGQLLAWIDEIASIVARRHAHANPVTAAIDNLIFKKGAVTNDIVVLVGHLTYVGRTSMEVRVDTYVESMDGMRAMINRAYVVMVAMDEKYRPMKVPSLIVEGETEKAEWEAGVKRSELRKMRKIEGF
ncbi:acyl-CoA thioesterase [Anaerosacchariphilus polymeriproducens]|uniref:Acyl-CoA thioesterase n=1 Tax=Anaerosacchariphilus polymeriproducens TaxID=1812858 RepID=A0A371AXU5_9FIRM|nr:acyl-CoA thioesterase [Anaerosacchariphilus polymeriproducens]RDU24300.1 acyl-CoA thioesterase [Anaerosacchariphilus polymeriproducens]